MKKFIPFAFYLGWVVTAFASGNGAGNGGVGLGHLDPSGEISAVEMLDHFEAVNGLFDVDYVHAVKFTFAEDLSVESAVNRALERAEANPGFARELRESLRTIEAGFTLLPDGVEVESTADAFPKYRKSHTRWVQIAEADEDGRRLNVDRALYAKMNDFNRAMLKVHEAVYLTARRSIRELDSRRSRAITAMLMSENAATFELQLLTDQIVPLRKKPIVPSLPPLLSRCERTVTFTAGLTGDEGISKRLTLLLMGKEEETEAVVDLRTSDSAPLEKSVTLPCSALRKFSMFGWVSSAESKTYESEYSIRIEADGVVAFETKKPAATHDFGGFPFLSSGI